MLKMRNLILKLIMAVMTAVALSGCIISAGSQSSGRKGAPVVYIHPKSNMYVQSKVGILPFHVPPNMTDEQGRVVAELFKEILLAKQAFPVVKQLNTPYGDFEEAIKIGRDADVDLVVAGSINYFIDGAGFGGAQVDASVRLLNTRTLNTVWYIEQTINESLDYPDVSFVNRLRSTFLPQPTRRHPDYADSTTTKMLAGIASAMADVLKAKP